MRFPEWSRSRSLRETRIPISFFIWQIAAMMRDGRGRRPPGGAPRFTFSTLLATLSVRPSVRPPQSRWKKKSARGRLAARALLARVDWIDGRGRTQQQRRRRAAAQSVSVWAAATAASELVSVEWRAGWLDGWMDGWSDKPPLVLARWMELWGGCGGPA